MKSGPSGIPCFLHDIVKGHSSAHFHFRGDISLNIPWPDEWSRACFLNQSIVISVLTQVEILDEAEMIRRLQRRTVACERTWSFSLCWAFH